MSKRYPWAKWTLPITIDPPRTCYTIPVPDDPYHKAAFRGALLALASATKWQDDSAHTAKAAAAVWMEIYDLVVACADDPQAVTYTEDDNMPLTRVVCVDNVPYFEVQVCACPETWMRLANASQVDVPGQPGGGGTVPPSGSCTTYHASFIANNQWLLPVVVNAGDVLTFSLAKGAGTDGGISGLWNCPNGQTFFAGGCVGIAGPKAGDIAPLLNHMQLIAKIGAVWYPCDTGTITVPGGIANEQVVIQCNDSNIADNSGSYTLDIEYCNNAATTYTHTFNFLLNTGGFVTENFPAYIPQYTGAWAAGSGWLSSGAAASGQTLHAVQIQRVLGASHVINTAVLSYDLTKGTVNAGLTNGLFLQLGATSVVSATRPSNTDPNGTALTFTITPGSYTIDSIYIEIKDGWSASPGSPGTSRAYQLVVTGPGSDPW